MRDLSLLVGLLNFGLPFYGAESLFIFSLLLSWSSSTLIESVVLDRLLRRQGYPLRFTAVIGWTSVVQVISTLLSSATALLIFGGMIWISPLPQTISILQLSLSLLWNPFGVFIGFFIIPVVFEYLLWRRIWRQLRSIGQLTQHLEIAPLSSMFLLSLVVIANACSFLFGALLHFNLIPALFGFPSGLMLIILIIGFFVWFLYTTQTVISLRAYEEPIERTNTLMEVCTR